MVWSHLLGITGFAGECAKKKKKKKKCAGPVQADTFNIRPICTQRCIRVANKKGPFTYEIKTFFLRFQVRDKVFECGTVHSFTLLRLCELNLLNKMDSHKDIFTLTETEC